MAKLKALRPELAKLASRVGALQGTPRIRGSVLQGIRARHFARYPLCVECERHGRVSAATELDHIAELADGGAESEANRQGLCAACHRRKTAAAIAARHSAAAGGGGRE